MHVYQIGNSLTRNLTMDRLHLLMERRGIDYQYAAQLAVGSPARGRFPTRSSRGPQHPYRRTSAGPRVP
jgi:hypothetical protein